MHEQVYQEGQPTKPPPSEAVGVRKEARAVKAVAQTVAAQKRKKARAARGSKRTYPEKRAAFYAVSSVNLRRQAPEGALGPLR